MKAYVIKLTKTEAEALTYAIGSINDEHKILSLVTFNKLVNIIFGGIGSYDRSVKRNSSIHLYYDG
jgi:hypothetical protein